MIENEVKDETTKAVSIVTIKEKMPLFRNGEEANSIELVKLEEFGFELVSQKDLYKVGDKAVYIQPDFSLSDIELFSSFIRPNGDESKSMLGKIEGKPRRIRAKSFNFYKDGSTDKVYSNGIMLPIDEVRNFLDLDEINDSTDLTKLLGIEKYVEPEDKGGSNGGLNVNGGRSFPKNVYKTDETNILNVKNRITFPIRLIGTEKIDGSSITFGKINGEDYICSRNLSKPFKIKKVVGRRKKNILDIIKSLFGIKVNLNIYKEIDNDDDFIKYGKPLLDKIDDDNILFRGELNGGNMKGSGNKHNPSKSLSPNIVIFGVDQFNENGIAYKAPFDKMVEECNKYDFNMVKVVFDETFNSFEEIELKCNEYFKSNLIEGIVLRSEDSKFSSKFMNLEYDSKK